MTEIHNCLKHETMGTGSCPKCVAEADEIRARAKAVQQELNKSAIMKRSRGKAAMERLEQRLLEIRGTQRKFTAQVMGINALIYVVLLIWFHGDTTRTNQVYTNTFQYQAVAWCCWFMLPYFLRVEAKQDVGLAMGHDTVDLMDKLDDAVESRLKRADDLMDSLDQMAKEARRGEGELVKVFKDEMKQLRDSIEKKKEETEGELSEALDEGERAAAAIEQGGKTPPA